MDFTILPYDRLPEYIRENENLRQILLQSGGIMKFAAEHIDDPTDDETPQLFVQYQNFVAENYRRANRYNPNRQTWSVEDLRQRALNGSNHLWNELQSHKVLMLNLRMQTDLPFGAKNIIDQLNWKYLEYAWMEDLRRRRPDIDTDLGTYKFVMEQFKRFGWPMMSDGLACRSIDLALKKHHRYVLTETDNFDGLNIDMFHAHFSWPTIINRLWRGLAELLRDKNSKECRKEAMSMLNGVRWFSQHIYNDEVEDVYNDSFTIEDKKWLRSLLEHYDRDRFGEEELSFFYFGKLFADIGRLWKKQLRRYPDIDLSELEKEANSFVNTTPSKRQITWEEKKQYFKAAVLMVMEKKRTDGDYLFKNNSQWMAVYRFAIDLEIMYDVGDPRKPKDTSTPQYALFANFAHELQLDENPPTRLSFTKNAIDSIKSKPNYARYNTSHPWSYEGISDPRSLLFFIEMDNVYLALEEEYNNLVSQAERVID